MAYRTRFGALAMIGLIACTSGGSPETPTAGEETPALRPENAPEDICSGRAESSVDGTRKAVRMEISPCHATADQAASLVLTNTGKGRLGYAPGFKLERKTVDGWRWVNRKQGFNLPLFYLGAGKHSDPESLAVYIHDPEPIELDPGLYRVTKGVISTPEWSNLRMMTVRATFHIDA